MRKHDYKERMIWIGASDIASLIAVGIGVNGLETHILNYGGDDSYKAYVLYNDEEIPNHYKLETQFKNWVKIYDDQIAMIEARGDIIEIYRAGGYGTLIRVKGDNPEVKRIDC